MCFEGVIWDNIRDFTQIVQTTLPLKWRNSIILEPRIRQLKTSPDCQFTNLIRRHHFPIHSTYIIVLTIPINHNKIVTDLPRGVIHHGDCLIRRQVFPRTSPFKHALRQKCKFFHYRKCHNKIGPVNFTKINNNRQLIIPICYQIATEYSDIVYWGIFTYGAD